MQFSLFDGAEEFKVNKPIRLIELFAGIGAQAAALRNIGADFEHYRICEFDKYAVQSYNAVHGTNFATSDITTITAEDLGVTETEKFCYIMTYSFPCTDLSQAGQMKGMQKGSGTRSGLLWEVERLLAELSGTNYYNPPDTTMLPQVLLMENVPQVLTAEGFADWIEFLENLGYKNRYEVLNAKDFGIPQNRERAFMVSLLGDFYYEFPKPQKQEISLKNVLEKEVDEKFYITNVQFENVIKNNFTQEKLRLQQKEYCDTILARDFKSPKLVCVGKLNNPPYDKMHDISKRVYSCGGLSPTIHTCGGGNLEPKIIEDFYVNREPRIYENIAPTLRSGRSGLKVLSGQFQPKERNYNTKKIKREECFETRKDNLANCVLTDPIKNCVCDLSNYRVRKLTPKECWRLMGFYDKDIDACKKIGVSNSQLYKQAGNSIVVNVLEEIFKQMF